MSDVELSVTTKDRGYEKLLPSHWLWRAVLPIALLVLLFGFAVVDQRVLSPANLLNIAQQTSYLALFAMAQTVVILTRGFDLALGPTVSMVSVGTALAMAGATATGHDTTVVLLAGLGAGFGLGIACGLFNGVVIAILGVSPFVATLGSYNIAIGVATTLSSGRPVQGVPNLFSQIFYGGSVFGVPAAIVITVVIGIAAAIDAGSHRLRPIALHHRHQSARRGGGWPAGETNPGHDLCALLGACCPRRHHDDGTHGFWRAQPRRFAVAAGDRRRRGGRNQPRRRSRRGRHRRARARCSSRSCLTA